MEGTQVGRARRGKPKDLVRLMTLKVFFTLGSDEQSGAASTTSNNKRKPLLARSPQPVPVRILRPRRLRPSSTAGSLDPSVTQHQREAEQPLFGEVALRPILSAVCRSAPDLLADEARDFAVAALDVVDGWKNKTARDQERDERRRKGKRKVDDAGEDEEEDGEADEDEGVWEGKGMMRWCLASSTSSAAPNAATASGPQSSAVKPSVASKDKDAVTVRGRIQGVFLEDLEHWAAMKENGEEDEDEEDDDDRELEVHLQLISRPILSRQAFLNQLGSPVRRSPRGHNSPVYNAVGNAFPLVGEPPVSPTSGKSAKPRGQGADAARGLARSMFATSPAAPAPVSQAATMRPAPPLVSADPTAQYPPAAIAYLRDLLGKQSRPDGPPPLSPRLMYDRIVGLASLRGSVDVGSADEVQRRSAKHLVNTMKSMGLIPTQDLAGSNEGEDDDVMMSTSPREMSTGEGSGLGRLRGPPATGIKRKRTTSATPSMSGSSAIVVAAPGIGNIPVTVYEVRDPADAHIRDKRKKQQWKWDQEGCENCKVQKSSCWMQRRKRGNELDAEELANTAEKLCYTCGQFWNKNGSHRPVKPGKRLPKQGHLQPPGQVQDGDNPSPSGSGSGSNAGTPSASGPLAPLPVLAPKSGSSLSFPPRPFKSALSMAAERESAILQRNLARRAQRLEASGKDALLPPPATSPSGKCSGRYAGVRPKPASVPLQRLASVDGKRKAIAIKRTALLPQGIMTSPPRGSSARGRQMSLPPGGPGGVSVTSPVRGSGLGDAVPRSPGKSGYAAGTAGGYASDGDGMAWFDAIGNEGSFDASTGLDLDFSNVLDLDLAALSRGAQHGGAAATGEGGEQIPDMTAADLFNSLDFSDFNPPPSTSPSIAASANALAAVVGDGFLLEPSKRPTPSRNGNSNDGSTGVNMGMPPTTAARTEASTQIPSIFSSSFANHIARRAFTSDVGTSPSLALAKSAKRRKTDGDALVGAGEDLLMSDVGNDTGAYRDPSMQELMDGFEFDHQSLEASFALDELLSNYSATASSAAPSAPSMTSQESDGPSSSAASHSSGATVVGQVGGPMFGNRLLGTSKKNGVINSGLSSAIRTRLQPFSRHSSSDRLLSDASSMLNPSSPPLPPPSDCSEGITPLSERNGDRPTDTDGDMADAEFEEDEEDYTAKMQYDLGQQSSSTDDLLNVVAASHSGSADPSTDTVARGLASSGSNLSIISSATSALGGPELSGLPPEILAAMSGALEAGWTTDALAEALKAVSEGGADALMASLGLPAPSSDQSLNKAVPAATTTTRAADQGQGQMDVFEALFNGSASP